MISQLIYNGKNLKDFGVTIEHLPESAHPQRRGDAYRIAGRNGSRVREDGTFDNYDQPYDVWFRDFAVNRDVYQVSRDLADFLLGSSDYCRLEDTYEPEIYRLARFAGPLNIEAVLRRYGRAKLVFDCQPERFLKSGEQAITLWENLDMMDAPGGSVSQTVNNPTSHDAAPLIRFTGTGSFVIAKPAQHAADAMMIGVTLDDSTAETIEIDCASYAVNFVETVAGVEMRSDASARIRYLTQYPTLTRLAPGSNTVRLELYDVMSPAVLQSFEIIPRWWTA